MKKIGFGIVGCGVISKWHAEAIISDERAKLIGVTDKNIESANRFASEYGCNVFCEYEDMLKSDSIDIICICTPSGLHAPLAMQAADNKKHIVVEKPVGITQKQLDQMTEICNKNNIKVCVISQLRYTPAIQFVKQAIKDGALGDLLIGDVFMKYYRDKEYYKNSNWRGTWNMDGGGALMNQGIHGIDLLLYLMGPIKSLYGKTQTLLHDIEVEDTSSAIVEYENGAIGVIIGTTSVHPGYPRRIEITGTKGTVVIEEDSIISWDVNEYPIPDKLIRVQSDIKGANDPTSIPSKYHKLQISDMIDAVLYDKQPLVNLYEGKNTVEVILGIYNSSSLNKKIVLKE